MCVCVCVCVCVYSRGTRWRSWLRHCATSRKVAGSIPDSFIGTFHWHNPSGRTMALGLIQPLTEMSTRNISWGGGLKSAGAYGWQPYHLHVAIVLKSGSFNLLKPSGLVDWSGKRSGYSDSLRVGLSGIESRWGGGARISALVQTGPPIQCVPVVSRG